MENTSHFLFDNKEEKYFLALQGKAIGPLTAQEVFERLSKAEVSLMNYMWKEGWGDWKRISDEKEFSVLIPKKPTLDSIEHIQEKLSKKKAAVSSASDEKLYFLYHNKTQYGPFSKEELLHIVRSGKVGSNAFVWMSGWPNWKRMSELAEFTGFFKNEKQTTKTKKTDQPPNAPKTKSTSTREKREEPRKPLVARLFLHNDADVIVAVCRDISVGGMQVLTDRVPGPVGSKIRLNVSPGDPSKVESFVAEGEIVRHLEDGRGFSFRFLKISDQAKKAISKYIKN